MAVLTILRIEKNGSNGNRLVYFYPLLWKTK